MLYSEAIFVVCKESDYYIVPAKLRAKLVGDDEGIGHGK